MASNSITKAENFDGRILGYTVIGLDATPAKYENSCYGTST